MLQIEVTTRENLSHIIERAAVHKLPGMTIADIMGGQCPDYTPERAAAAYLSLYADGVKIPAELWSRYQVSGCSRIKIVIEAGGLETSLVIGIISVVLAVASAVYGIVMANKLGKGGPAETKQGSSIYDVNAQGNQVNLTNVIPENFGKFKRFPDYLADRHVFYRNSVQFVDMILCQGVGYYDRAGDGSDVYIGETPIKELPGCELSVFDPGTVITAENSPGDKSWYCYYSSTEVTGSGHTLEPVITEIDQSSQNESSATFSGASFSGGYYTYQMTDGGTQGPGGVRIYHALDLTWPAGSFFTISGASGIRPIGTAGTSDVTDLGDTISVNVTLAAYFESSNQAPHRAWLRPRETDPDDPTIITSAGDTVNVTAAAITGITYTIISGTGGPQTVTDSATAEITSIAELLGIAYDGSGSAELLLDAAELDIPAYPAAPAAPPGAQSVTTSQSIEIRVTQPVPADYPFGNDNGLYEIVSITDGVYLVQLVDSGYEPVASWTEFWAQETPQSSLTFTLDDTSSEGAGAYAGPYRACPYGAESSRFEYDIRFPGGLGYLQDNGTFRDLTVTLEIGYRRAGSDDAWTTETKTFTAHTNDELAYTYTLEADVPGNYEFRIRNVSEANNSTRARDEVKWVGLKSVISTVNKYDGITVMIGRFRGTETLSELSGNQLATYWTRKLPDISTGVLTATRDIAPAVKYIVNSSKYAGIIDNASLAEYDALWRARSLKLDGTLDGDGTLLSVLRDVLSVGFAAPVIENNKLAFSRLHPRGEYEPLAQIFTPQNLTGSPEITFNLPREDDVDEIVVEYTDPATYKTASIYCRVDENGDADITDYPDSAHQEKLRAFGVTSRDQAEAMGMRRLRYLRETRVTYKIQTELDGLNCQYNDLVGLVLDEDMSNITGRVTSQDGAGTGITVDMEIPRNLTAGVIYIRKTDGTCLTTTYSRVDSHHLTLADSMPAWNNEFGASIEYPFFAIGELAICWVTAVEPQDKTVTLTLVNYSEDIFTDDIIPSEGYGISPYGIVPYGEPM